MDVREHIPEGADEIEGIEKLSLVSVGIDIGSSTSHLTFSELIARRQGTGYSSQFEVTGKKLTYQSEIILTPYLEGNTIDVDTLGEFIENAYEEAGYTQDDVDTGAVIVTGEAAKKKNADRIAEIFSERAGKFVTASAVPTLEAIMAAHGSGAVDPSEETDGKVMNLDVGGGTSKITTIEDGEVIDTASINVGARLVATDEDGVLERAEATARTVAEMADLDLDLTVGEPLDDAQKDQVAGVLADSLFEFVSKPREEYAELTEELTIAHTDFSLEDVDAISFSGGCSEFIYGSETTDFGDLGLSLGPAVMDRAQTSQVPVERTKRGIRATVVGSTQYSVQISGNTIHTTSEDLLPVRNSQVLSVEMSIGDSFEQVFPRVEQALERFDLGDLDQAFALCFAVDGTVPTMETMRTIADVAATTWEEYDREGPLLVILDMDLAQSVGSHIEKRLSDRGVIVVDGIDVGSLEYVDVGAPLEDSGAVPVIVKSLVFGARPE